MLLLSSAALTTLIDLDVGATDAKEQATVYEAEANKLGLASKYPKEISAAKECVSKLGAQDEAKTALAAVRTVAHGEGWRRSRHSRSRLSSSAPGFAVAGCRNAHVSPTETTTARR